MTDDPVLLGALACALYTAVCIILVAIVIWQNDRINVLEAEVGIVERKEYRLESQQEAQLRRDTGITSTGDLYLPSKPPTRDGSVLKPSNK